MKDELYLTGNDEIEDQHNAYINWESFLKASQTDNYVTQSKRYPFHFAGCFIIRKHYNFQ